MTKNCIINLSKQTKRLKLIVTIYTEFEVLGAVLLTIQAFWHVKQSRRVNGSRLFGGYCRRSVGTTDPTTQRYIPGDLSPLYHLYLHICVSW